MPKIKDLIQFEKIKEVIDIDRDVKHDQDRKKLVSEYVISDAVKDHLQNFFKDLLQPTHKSIEIIGGYGSGKSHLLAFIYSVLFEPSLRQYIQNEDVRKAAEKIQRNFVIIRSELQSGRADLSAYFFDRVQQKLASEYGIQITYKQSDCPDYKAQLQYVIETIKEKDPTCGLVVIFDEISDFIKGKTKDSINRDMQFLRILGQESQSSDFIFIGAMQEQVFSNPRYVDESQSFGRISERFNIITIQKEEIEKVLSQRILKKSSSQQLELEKLIKPLEKIYPNLMANIQRFIDLYPIHPYVIDVFNALPYFEKRGVLQFAIQQVEKILDNEYPGFVTYHEVFNEISSKHTIKHLESIKPVLEAVRTLESKMDLLDKKDRSNADKIVKALAIQHLLGSNTSKHNGANPEELANSLLLTPAGIMDIQDEVLLTINNLRKVTDGQFINKTKDNYFYIDLSLAIDYDEIIQRKMSNPSEPAMENQICRVFADQLHLSSNSNTQIYEDTASWKSHKSYREGFFVYGNHPIDASLPPKDYVLIVQSPLKSQTTPENKPGHIHFFWKLTAEALELTKKISTLQILIHDNSYRSVMEERLKKLEFPFRKALVDSAIEYGSFVMGNVKKTVKSLIDREFSNFSELFSVAKIDLLDKFFLELYPKHPNFTQTISKDNIKDEIARAIKDILKNNPQDWTQNTKSLLTSLGLINDKGYIHHEDSEAAKLIIDEAKTDDKKLHSTESITDTLSQKPFGLPSDMTQFLLFVLCYSGIIELKGMQGKTINSSNSNEYYANGLPTSPFKYYTLSQGLPISQIKHSLELLGLPQDAIQLFERQSNLEMVLQKLKEIAVIIKSNRDNIQKTQEKLNQLQGSLLRDDEINDMIETAFLIPLDDWLSIKRPTELIKLAYSSEQLASIEHSLSQFKLLDKWSQHVADKWMNASRMIQQIEEKLQKSRNFLQENVIDYTHIMQGIEEVKSMSEQTHTLFAENQWSRLLGKMSKIQDDYKKLYYHAHEDTVGKNVPWTLLDDITSNAYFQKLKMLKNIDNVLNQKLFFQFETELATITSWKCLDFNPDMLDYHSDCPKCHFPLDTHTYKNIEHWVKQSESTLELYYKDWQKIIIKELVTYKDNIKHLASKESQKELNDILNQKELPETITAELIMNFNEIFKEIIPIVIDPIEFTHELFGEQAVLSYYDFERKWKQYQQKITQGNDIERIRIKLKASQEEA